MYQHPATKESDIPHHTKLHDEIIEKANVAIEQLKNHLKTVLSKFSITFDAWTLKAYNPCLAVTAHYIDTPPDQLNEWQLKSKVLALEELQGHHTGENMATKIIKVLEQYEIQDKIGWATSDNASANDKAMQSLDRKLNKDCLFLKGCAARDHHVQ
ncbi:hypothetical protein APHAL10511_008680 [Amanita phalloides]|nr:hypothetical protein APHAL10511_008680 [Amanita phalloides]